MIFYELKTGKDSSYYASLEIALKGAQDDLKPFETATQWMVDESGIPTERQIDSLFTESKPRKQLLIAHYLIW